MTDPALPSFSRLSGLLLADRPAAHPVAWRGGPGGEDVPLSWDDFRRHVAALERELVALPPGRVALYAADSYAFAVGLFAIAHAGRVAVCPPNDQPGTLESLADMVIAAVSDGAPVPGRPLVEPAVEGAPPARGGFAPLAPGRPLLELFTSGTTGRGKAVTKTLAHLDLEVQGLDATFGAKVGAAPTFGSASHQHLYGMLFRVLWPLAAGRPFHARAFLHAEELLSRMRARGECVLASVPAHLRRLGEREGVEALGRYCRVVFSSGGPLAAETAERWAQVAGSAPVEVFGSTETGGVAWRSQGPGRAGAPWTPFSAVRVARDPDGRLRVHSPFASLGDEGEGFAMGDRATLREDGRFALEGRADRIVKVGEKRVSLPDMEERLLEHAFVEAVALLSTAQGGEARVGAVVVLSEPGAVALAHEGRRVVGQALADALARDWDRVLLPRAWRFVDALPEDAQGKITLSPLRALFEDEPVAAGSRRAGTP